MKHIASYVLLFFVATALLMGGKEIESLSVYYRGQTEDRPYGTRDQIRLLRIILRPESNSMERASLCRAIGRRYLALADEEIAAAKKASQWETAVMPPLAAQQQARNAIRYLTESRRRTVEFKDGSYCDNLNALYYAHTYLKEFTESEKYAREWFTLEMKRPVITDNAVHACFNLGYALSAEGKRVEAISAYEQSLRIDRLIHGKGSGPLASLPYTYLTLDLERSGRIAEALTLLEERIRRDKLQFGEPAMGTAPYWLQYRARLITQLKTRP